MALSEFVALEAAYRALQPLDAAARGRAMRWLTDALAVQDHLAESSESPFTGDSSGSAALNVTQRDAVALRPGPAAESAVRAEKLAGDETTTVEGATVTDDIAANAEGRPESRPAPTAARAGATARGGRKRPTTGVRDGRKARGGKQPEKERVYRRMPPVNDVLTAYKKVGTVSGLAGYFDVPRHTVQGWARRLRSAGYEIGRKSETGE